MVASFDIGTLIVTKPNICGGIPHIEGTRITVKRIILWYKMGINPETIKEEIPHLSLAQIHAALAYYYANKKEIDADIQREEAEYEKLVNKK